MTHCTHTLRRRGFTLIELIVVIAILGILAGMLFPLVLMSKRYAERVNTDALLRKVDTALRLFKTDVRVFPWDGHLQPRLQADGTVNSQYDIAYPDLSTTQPSWSNRLLHHLATVPEPAARAAVLADAESARRAFAYDLTNSNGNIASKLQEVGMRYGPHAFLKSDGLPYGFGLVSGVWKPSYNDGMALAAGLNRMAQERYPLAMLAGAVRINGPQLMTVTAPNGTVYASANPQSGLRGGSRLVPAPASGASPGWSDDYLHGELEKRNIAGEAIVDIWKRPLIYVGQVLPGCEPAGKLNPMGIGIDYLDETLYGLGAQGRRSLAAYDAYHQRPLAADGAYLPDPQKPFASDIRRYAAPPFAMEFELWSAGRDGRFAWMRDDPSNLDNLAARNYLVGLR